MEGGNGMRLSKILSDEDFLRAAFDADDAVSLCAQISQRHGYELTLDQAAQLLEKTDEVCISCLGDAFDDEGYCVPCSVPGSGSATVTE